MRYRSIWLAAALLSGSAGLAVAGQGTAPIELSRTYQDTSKQKVWDRIVAALQQHDIPIFMESFERGAIRARQSFYLNPQFAHCVYGRVQDPGHPVNLGARFTPLWRGIDLRLEIVETTDGSTMLKLDRAFYDHEIDSQHREFPYQIPCQSTGHLEQALLQAPLVEPAD